MHDESVRIRPVREFRSLVTSRRQDFGLTYDELTEAIGVNARELESGKLFPHPTRLWHLCETLDIDPAELLWSLQNPTVATVASEGEGDNDEEESEDKEEGEDGIEEAEVEESVGAKHMDGEDTRTEGEGDGKRRLDAFFFGSDLANQPQKG
jgi:transcriptional regulator with XRE-family HTH domain